jgi:hypothetical protein
VLTLVSAEDLDSQLLLSRRLCAFAATPSYDAKGDQQPMKDTHAANGETEPDQSGRQDALIPVPHTQVHARVRRTFENLQDVIVSLLMMLLLVLSLQSLWRLTLT